MGNLIICSTGNQRFCDRCNQLYYKVSEYSRICAECKRKAYYKAYGKPTKHYQMIHNLNKLKEKNERKSI